MEDDSSSNDGPQRTVVTASWSWLWATLLILVVLLLAPIGVWLLSAKGSKESPRRQPPTAADAENQRQPSGPPGGERDHTMANGLADPADYYDAPAEEPSEPGEEVDELQRKQVMLVRWRRIEDRIDGIESVSVEAQRELTRWLDASSALQSDADGKRLASDSRLLEQYQAISSHPDITEAAVQMVRNDLKALRGPVSKALELGRFARDPNEEFLAEIEQIEKEAREWLQRYRDKNDMLKSLLRRAPAEVPVDAVALGDALKSLKERQVEQWIEQIDRELADYRAERINRLRDVTNKVEQMVHDAEVDSIERVGETKAETIKAETDMLVEEERRRIAKKLGEEAEAQRKAEYQQALPDIKRCLAPFVTPSFAQPVGYSTNRSVDFETTVEKRPVSLSFLRGASALEANGEGINRLSILGSYRFSPKPRPTWPSVGGSVDHELVVTAQRYLIDYGDLLVEDKLLEP